jgi:hypothetical protein
MHVLLWGQLIVLLSATFAPSSDELRNRYGPPDSEHRNAGGFLDSESFSMRPWVSLTAHYGSDQRACQIELTPGLGLEKSAQYQYVFGDTLSEVLEEIAPSAKRGKQLGEGTLHSSLHFTEYENLLVKQTQNFAGVTSVTVSFNRDACPKPQNPFVFLPPLDAKAILSLTPTPEELQKRYGPNSGLNVDSVFDIFVLSPDVKLSVRYGSDRHACQIEIEPADGLSPYIPVKRVSELFGEVAPAAMRGKIIGGGEFQSSACGGAGYSAYENVLLERIHNFCAPEHPATEKRATIKFNRDVCPSPYSPVVAVSPHAR